MAIYLAPGVELPHPLEGVGQVFVTGVVTFLTQLSFYLVPGIRTGLHIVADIINHFWLCRGRPGEPPRLAVRESVQARFRAALAVLFREAKPTRLLIIAHSQGTMIAFDGLEDQHAELAHVSIPVHLVTMGSPLQHLYREYFPNQYGPGRATFKVSVPLWLNLYRPDDYIGTVIAECHAAPSPPTAPFWYGQAVGGHDHVAYWTQRDLLRIVLRQVFRPGAT
jgi:hypothetical protein